MGEYMAKLQVKGGSIHAVMRFVASRQFNYQYKCVRKATVEVEEKDIVRLEKAVGDGASLRCLGSSKLGLFRRRSRPPKLRTSLVALFRLRVRQHHSLEVSHRTRLIRIVEGAR
jgi:hypothetical protein